MTRDEVLQEFAMWTGHPNPPRPLQTYWYNPDAMADEIVRLRELVERTEWEREQAWQVTQQQARTLAALREPSEAVKIAVQEAVERETYAPCHYREAEQIVRAAVAEAEKEVQP